MLHQHCSLSTVYLFYVFYLCAIGEWLNISIAVPGIDACEITMVHQEDAGLNVEMAKLAFAKGIWSYVSKMNSALREYSSFPSHLTMVPTLLRLIKKVSIIISASSCLVVFWYQGKKKGN